MKTLAGLAKNRIQVLALVLLWVRKKTDFNQKLLDGTSSYFRLCGETFALCRFLKRIKINTNKNMDKTLSVIQYLLPED
ncbi:MAG: hypothetical protein NTZ74_10260 [Chloroflexi bacterium]|nr:hypothetical protein [Chloroflexota bacterium]